MTTAQHFTRALDDLATRMGVCREAITPDELAELVFASDRCAHPFRGVNADAAGMPVKVVDGVWFWKLTIGAAVWLDDMAQLFGGTSSRYRQCLIYALVHARDCTAFALANEDEIVREVKRTCRTIVATPEEVNEAIDEVLGIRSRPKRARDVEQAAMDWCDVVARLESQTGISAHDWIWNHSLSYSMRCYNDLHTFAAAHAGGRRVETMRNELDDAMEALQLLKVRIMKRVKGNGIK